MITIDGVQYDVGVTEINRQAVIEEGPNAGFSLAKTKILDVIGTTINYSVALEVHGMSVAEYDALYEVLTDPTNLPHTVLMPYGQTEREFQYYTSTIDDSLVCVIDNQRWGELTMSFNAMAPGRTA